MKTLFIITGTTRGLGKSFYNYLNTTDNIILTINRKKTDSDHNIILDLSNLSEENINIFDETLNKYLTLNLKKVVFINNAFSMGEIEHFANLDNNKIKETININLISSMLLLKSFIKSTSNLNIKKQILNISSGAAQRPLDAWSIYCSTKAAIEMLVNNIKLEYPEYECYNIDPGVMNTDMQETIRAFDKGRNHDYFMDLFNKNHLLNTNDVAKKLITEYIK